ncbi:MAG: hypothetical protein IKB22_09305, partial [Lentisphaeria bacterium]|nr:hypothetical protein [Lentisphaeria bacterium]
MAEQEENQNNLTPGDATVRSGDDTTTMRLKPKKVVVPGAPIPAVTPGNATVSSGDDTTTMRLKPKKTVAPAAPIPAVAPAPAPGDASKPARISTISMKPIQRPAAA